jgi:ribosomal protein L33
MRRWRSGQSHLTVNQTPSGYVGSNPTLRTNKYKKHMPQKKIVKLKNKKTKETIYIHKSGKAGSSTMPKLKLKKYSKVTRKREVFEESKK